MRLWIITNGKHDLTSEGPDFTTLVISLRLTFTSLSSCWCPVVLRDLFNSSATDSVCSHSSHFVKRCHTILWLNYGQFNMCISGFYFLPKGWAGARCLPIFVHVHTVDDPLRPADRSTGQWRVVSQPKVFSALYAMYRKPSSDLYRS